MGRTLIACSLLVFLLISGCAAGRYETLQPENYPATHKSFDVTFGWKKTVTPSGIAIDGYARNNRYFLMDDLILVLSLLDSTGREKAKETFLFIPSRLPQDDRAYFEVVLPARPQPGDKLHFLYRYRGIEDSDGAISWMSSFEVPAAE